MNDRIVVDGDQLFHKAIFENKDGLTQFGLAIIKQDNESPFSFSYQMKWFAPYSTLFFEDKVYRLVGKTKRGTFKYEETDDATAV